MALFTVILVGSPFFLTWGWHHLRSYPSPVPPVDQYYRLGLILILWPILFRQAFYVFRQVVWHGDRLVWIENGNLIYRYLSTDLSVPCSEIAKVTTWVDGFFNQFDTITLHLHDGSEKIIRSDQFSESADVIAQRLRGALGLKPESSMIAA